MVDTAARLLVLLLGFSLCVFAVWGIYAPQRLLHWVRSTMAAPWGIYFAILVRLVLGTALIVAAPNARFPVAFLILGWIAVFAAIAAALLGRNRLSRFIDWWIERFSPSGVRAWVSVALAFGAFLVYGVW